jgi:hypothetical protein
MKTIHLELLWRYTFNCWLSLTTWLNNNIGLLTVIAILLAPIFALRVQKRLETAKEKGQRKLGIFKTLIATYATRVSPDHIQALNMINIEFYGIEAVLSSWHLYQKHLTTPIPEANVISTSIEVKESKRMA